MEFFDSKKLEGPTRLPVRLVLDTADAPLSEGVRRRDVNSRHLLYQAASLYLDLRLERDLRGPRVVVVGQLADLENPLLPVEPVPVLLLSEDEVLVRTGTNGYGEFQMIVEPRESMRLCLALEGDRLIEVPLDRRMMARLEDGEERAPA
jgi:hypothetical protein